MSLPKIVSPEEWTAARRAFLAKEKQATRQRDQLNAERRELPMVEVTKEYELDGPDGKVGLGDLFEGRPQLIIYHFMFHPEWDEGCPSCTAGTSELSAGLLDHLRTRDTSYAMVSRAAAREARALEGEARMGHSLVLVGRRGLQLRLRGHHRCLPGLRRVQLPNARRVRGHGPREHEDGRPAL